MFFGGYTVRKKYIFNIHCLLFLKKDNGYSNDVFLLDLVNLKWVKPLINGEAPRARENFSMNLVCDSYIWIFGGYCNGGETNDLW